VGIRETLNRNPSIATGVTLAVVVIAVAFIVYSQVGLSTPKPPSKAYFTIDDGATTFVDDIRKLPPFDYNGKQAVRVRMFKCGGEPFVGYLERYTADAKKQLERIRNDPPAAGGASGGRPASEMADLAKTARMGMEVKKRGDAQWILMGDIQNSAKIMQVKCPDNATGTPEVVTP
jgi:hypothetical protein